MTNKLPQEPASGMEKSLANVATLVYGLQAISFLLGITYLVAVIISHIKAEDAQGTWLASHFRWQIRTFWFSLLWAALGWLTFLLIIGYLILVADAVWVIYRIAKGWLYLNDRKPLYVPQ